MNILKRLLNIGRPLDPDDYRFLDFYLDEPGKFLFYQMNRVDQHHALAVARTVLSEASYLPGLDLLILIKAALLHDVGKVEGDFSIFSRLVVGLVRRSRPYLRGHWSIKDPITFWQKLRYGFYVDIAHPARGAHMARIFGIETSVVDMIRHHHDLPYDGQTPELTWLQLVDSRY